MIDEKASKCLICLLEEDKTKGKVVKFYYDGKRSSNRYYTFNRDVLSKSLNNFVKIDKKERIKRYRWSKRPVLDDEGNPIIEKTKRDYFFIKWCVLLDEWKAYLIKRDYLPSDYFREKYYSIKTGLKDERGQDIVLYDEMKAIEDGCFTRDHLFREFITKNREFLFNLEDFKILFCKDNKWYLPSVFGFMNMALFYFYYCASEDKDKILIKNTLPLLIEVHSRLLDEEHNKIRKRHEEFLKKHTDRFNEMYGNKEDEAKKGKALVIDLFFHVSEVDAKIDDWQTYALLLSEGVPVRLKYEILAKIIEHLNGEMRDTFYAIPIHELLQYLEPIERMIRLFE